MLNQSINLFGPTFSRLFILFYFRIPIFPHPYPIHCVDYYYFSNGSFSIFHPFYTFLFFILLFFFLWENTLLRPMNIVCSRIEKWYIYRLGCPRLLREAQFSTQQIHLFLSPTNHFCWGCGVLFRLNKADSCSGVERPASSVRPFRIKTLRRKRRQRHCACISPCLHPCLLPLAPEKLSPQKKKTMPPHRLHHENEIELRFVSSKLGWIRDSKC